MPYYNTPLILPCDNETINIKRGQRFLVDHEEKDGNPDAWIVTNRNVISKRFDAFDGVIEIALSQHQFNHLTDNKDLMVANYYGDYSTPPDVDEEAIIDCRIVYSGTSDLKMGMPFKKYTAEFYRNGELDTSIIANWDVLIAEENLEFFTCEIDENTIKIKCSYDSSLMGSHIRLSVTNDEFGCSAELPVKVVSNL